MDQRSLTFQLRFQRLLAKLFPQELYYIGGPDPLPPPLSPEEEREMTRRLKNHDETARASLIEHNLRLVVFISRRFENTGIPLEDLISIGTIGLIKAVGTFDCDKKIKMATYASRCIENEILMFLRKSSRLRLEVSLDEPLKTDWDGNELLLSDVLGTRPDTVSVNLDKEIERIFSGTRWSGSIPGKSGLSCSASDWAASGSAPRRRWPICWAFPKAIFPGWKNGS